MIAYGGDTWVWARASEEGRLAHRKFWRQVIFWLSHKENESDNQVKLNLDTPADQRRPEGRADRHRPRLQGNADLTGVTYETKVEREGRRPDARTDRALHPGRGMREGSYRRHRPARRTTRSPSIARKDGQEIGRDSSRFLVYQDDRELENPSADLALARQIAEITGGEAVHPREPGQVPEGHRPVGLYRVRQPHRAQNLGQLALPPDLHRPADPGMVAPQAARMGLERLELECAVSFGYRF